MRDMFASIICALGAGLSIPKSTIELRDSLLCWECPPGLQHTQLAAFEALRPERETSDDQETIGRILAKSAVGHFRSSSRAPEAARRLHQRRVTIFEWTRAPPPRV